MAGSWNARCRGEGASLRERQRIAAQNDHGPETPQQRRERLKKLRAEHQPTRKADPPGFFATEALEGSK